MRARLAVHAVRCAAFVLMTMTMTMTTAAARKARAQAGRVSPGRWQTGAQVYAAACAACHGSDGRGRPPALVGFEVQLPDFTDCDFATREPDADWFAISHAGGPARAFDRSMPAFGAALTEEEIQSALDHMRDFCSDDAWPRGELNFPRALVTEKAFPEDEAVFSIGVTTEPPVEAAGKIVYEARFGARNQFELVVPFGLGEPDPQQENDGFREGIGDVALGVKRALAHSLATGTIFSIAGEVILPTGDEADGLGKGTFIFEPFIAAGQQIPVLGFVQLQAGAELSVDTDRSPHEVFARAAVGHTFHLGRFGRSLTPMIEVLSTRPFGPDAAFEWDLVPEVQLALSTRQHVMWCAGLRVPVTQRDSRALEVMTYLLWDWFDGGLFEGW